MNNSQQKPCELQTVNQKELQSFQLMDINVDIIRGIYSVGFEKPSAIQRKSIPHMISGNDMIVQSEAGSGKTGAYVIGMLNKINQKSNQIQAIILTPVRQLALAVHSFIRKINQYTKIRVQCCVGGTLIKQQKYNINKEKPHIIVGTPGRVLDHIEKGNIKTDELKIVILDEADQLLCKMFVQQIIQLFKNIPQSVQICLFSATYTPQILQITQKFMKNPIKIMLSLHQVPVGGIKQFKIQLQQDSQKLPTLINICKKLLIHHWIIFVKTNNVANQVGEQLSKLGIPTTVIHSEVVDRNKALQEFKSGKTRILICTDVMGRGIDIASVSLVINYDMPHPRAATTQYIHRIGRCGRFGKAGVAISFVLPQDMELIAKIKRLYKVTIDDLPTQPKKIAPWLAPS